MTMTTTLLDRRGHALAERDLASFDRQFHALCSVQRPDRYRLLDSLPMDTPRIARGGGVSYVAASFGAGAISQEIGAFDRLLAFDADAGILTVEAGARIGDVQRFALAHDWYLAIAPGHPGASIGGCIAADAHGKNPARDGTFRAQVHSMQIHVPSRGLVTVDRQHEVRLFKATFAGFGLTGTVTQATLVLARPPNGLVVRRVPVANLAAAARVLREAANAPVLYGWHDGRAQNFGRGVVRIGLASDKPRGRRRGLPDVRSDLPAHINPLPVTLWNRTGIALANRWLRARWCRSGQAPMSLGEALFPLNRARTYFAGFGNAGMAEAQWLLAHAHFDAFSASLSDLVARATPRIALIASKLFAGDADGFRFDGHGIALAIQVPAPAERGQCAFLEALAELAIAHGGRPNLIKDSTLDATTARNAIDAFELTRTMLAELNPGGLRASELTRRLLL